MLPDNAAAEKWFQISRWGTISPVQDGIRQRLQSEKTENQCPLIAESVEFTSALKLALQWRNQNFHYRSGQLEFSSTRPI